MKIKKKEDFISSNGNVFSKKVAYVAIIAVSMFVFLIGCNDKTVSISEDWEVKLENVETRDLFKEGQSSIPAEIPNGVFKVIRVELTSHISGAVAVEMKNLVLIDENGVEYQYSVDGQSVYNKEIGVSTDSWYSIYQDQPRVFEIVYDVPEDIKHLIFVTKGSLPYAKVEVEE